MSYPNLPLHDAIIALAATRLPGAKAAEKAILSTHSRDGFADDYSGFAMKAEGFTDEGLIIAKVSVAGNHDRENERALLPALKAATYELAQNMGHRIVEVDINHEREAIKCDIVQTWIGAPMPDESATYVALRPHDPSVFEAAKAGKITGMSWSGPYRLVASR